jgi:hypothetical protein
MNNPSKSQNNDLRKGKPGAEPNVNTKMPGHSDQALPTAKGGEHAVNPGVGSKAGVAEGQVTKSN